MQNLQDLLNAINSSLLKKGDMSNLASIKQFTAEFNAKNCVGYKSIKKQQE